MNPLYRIELERGRVRRDSRARTRTDHYIRLAMLRDGREVARAYVDAAASLPEALRTLRRRARAEMRFLQSLRAVGAECELQP